jgi:hypothetical protein
MTAQDLIDILKAEGTDPSEVELVLPVGGEFFDLNSADEQYPWNKRLFLFALEKRIG